MISYKDNMDIFILAKVMEMNEKEKLNFVFEIVNNMYRVFKTRNNLCSFFGGEQYN